MTRRRIRNSLRSGLDSGRRGLTLLEVVLAVAILGFSLAAISQLMWIGYRSAADARARTELILLCDTKMAELAAGVLPLASTSGQTIPDAPDWLYLVDVQNSDQIGLLSVTVTVMQSPQTSANPITMSIVRFMPDPDYDPNAEQ